MMIQLQGLLSTITFLDVIDIVVVAYFLYRLFLMLKNTRAATLGKGLMVLIGFTLICRWLNLHVISWLLEKSMTVIMVALPVVFQPELRRLLEQIRNGNLSRVLWSKSAAASCFIRAASWTSRSWRKCWIPLLMPLR